MYHIFFTLIIALGDAESSSNWFKKKSHSIQVWLTYKTLCIFNVYTQMSLQLSIHPWNHHHDLCHKHVHRLQESPPTLFIIIVFLFLWWKHSRNSRVSCFNNCYSQDLCYNQFKKALPVLMWIILFGRNFFNVVVYLYTIDPWTTQVGTAWSIYTQTFQ